MKLKPWSVEGQDDTGAVILTYGGTGVGKSASAAASAPKKMLMLAAEQRDARSAFDAVGVPQSDYIIAEYTTWKDMLEFLVELSPKGDESNEDFNKRLDAMFAPYKTKWSEIKTICLDGLTQLMENLKLEIEDEAFISRQVSAKAGVKDKDDDGPLKELVQQSKLSMEGYGALANQMERFTQQFGKLSQQGKIVIMNVLLTSNPKWDRSLEAAPALAGKQTPLILPGKCDLIGLVVERKRNVVDENGVIIATETVFPPLIMFEESSVDDSMHFQHKWTGRRPVFQNNPHAPLHLPLDYTKILAARRTAPTAEDRKKAAREKQKPAAAPGGGKTAEPTEPEVTE